MMVQPRLLSDQDVFGKEPDAYYSDQQAINRSAPEEMYGFERSVHPRTKVDGNVIVPNESGDRNIIHPEAADSWKGEMDYLPQPIGLPGAQDNRGAIGLSGHSARQSIPPDALAKAEDAIARGAPRDAVMARLATWLGRSGDIGDDRQPTPNGDQIIPKNFDQMVVPPFGLPPDRNTIDPSDVPDAVDMRRIRRDDI